MLLGMSRPKFLLTSDQLELLVAFENSQGLGHLAGVMAKDPSVVSRNLQRIAEEHPVLEKVKGRWELTSLGIQVNEQTRAYLAKQTALLSPNDRKSASSAPLESATLVVINSQKGLLDTTQEGRSNSDAERNIARLLHLWRSKKRTILHVKHVSDDPGSLFFRGSPGCAFLESLAPVGQEVILEKTKSSAFTETNLEGVLSALNATNLVLVGFTANECIDATARSAAEFGFETTVVGDATASFDIRNPSGKILKADRVHQLTLSHIHALYAKVVNTDALFTR